MADFDTLKVINELNREGLPVTGVSTEGEGRIDFLPEATQDQIDLANAILEKHKAGPTRNEVLESDLTAATNKILVANELGKAPSAKLAKLEISKAKYFAKGRL